MYQFIKNLISIFKKVEIKMYLISTLFFVLLIIAALTVYYDTKSEEKNFFDIVEKHSHAIIKNLTPNLFLFLENRTEKNLNNFNKKLSSNKEIKYFKILNQNNKILLSNEQQEINKQWEQLEIEKINETSKPFTRVFIDDQGKRIFELITPIFSSGNNQMRGKLVLGLSMDEIHLVVNAGRYKLIALGFSLFMLGGAGIIFNVSYYSYRNVQHALDNIKSYTDSIFLSMDLGVIATDLAGKITIVNNAIKKILGIEDLIDKNIYDIFPQEESKKIFQEALNNFCGMKTLELQYAYEGKNKFLRITTSILKNNHNVIMGLVVLAEDVSELKELEKQAYRADKVSALGRLAAGVAHEIKNPLSAMNINVQLVEEELVNYEQMDNKFREKLLHYINIIYSETHRLEEIIKNFIDFTKIDLLKKENVSLGLILKEVIDLIGPEAKRRKVKINKKFEINPDKFIKCDRNKIKQLLLNLVINSLQAMPNGGTLTLAAIFDNSSFVIIEIEDTGIGIRRDEQDKIFDLYYTTKKSGSGLGLSICQRIVEEHHGTIEFVTDFGKGTKFTIKLPIEGASV